MRPEWGMEKMKSFMQRLSANVGGLIRVNEVSRIISGEFVMLVLGSDQIVNVEKTKGAPLEFVIPADAAEVHFIYMGIPRTAAHPNLSKLFVNTIMSEDGQRILYDMSFADHHELPGSRRGAVVKELKAKGIEPLKIDLKFLLDHPEIHKVTSELQKILLPTQ
jgi:ABC-type Fe3+ transport system substrate-binding protein